MKKLLIITGLIAAALFGTASSAGAAASACYSAQVTVNGASVVNEAGCQTTP